MNNKSRRSFAATPLAALAFATLPLSLAAQLQPASFETTRPSSAVSTSRAEEIDAPVPVTLATADAGGQATPNRHSLAHAIGVEVHLGLNGVGADIAVPVARKFNVRVGGQYIQYTGHFTSDGAQIDASLHLGNGKASLDWFPFSNGFHVSPQVFFAIQTDVNGTVIVPAGQTISLDGGDYVSSNADPLHGTAHVSTRKAAPGLAIGWGNISPRNEAHWSFPVEIGFYYIGQPKLEVTFDGSACDPAFPQPLGCQKVLQDPASRTI